MVESQVVEAVTRVEGALDAECASVTSDDEASSAAGVAPVVEVVMTIEVCVIEAALRVEIATDAEGKSVISENAIGVKASAVGAGTS